jgi:hypothetical protein
VTSEDIAHRLIQGLVSEIRHGTHYPLMPPTRILLGHSYPQTLDFLSHGRTGDGLAKPRSIKLFGDQFAIPVQLGVRLGSSCNARQGFHTNR